MKKDTHPKNYREVIFHDNSSGAVFLVASTVKTTEIGTFEGKEYPLYRVEISSASHPFYTGNEKVIARDGSVKRFKKRRPAER